MISKLLAKFRSIILFTSTTVALFNNAAFGQADDYGPQTITSHTIAIPGVPSPNAASLGQYANYVVSNFTGAPSVSVPIYELKEGNFKLPISLNYNPTGIKVQDIASWVGSGWSLNCGGVITRNVMDVPDDYSGNSGTMTQRFGMLYLNYIRPYDPSFSGGIPKGYSYDAPVTDRATNYKMLRQGRSLGQMDTEPDIFYFNFNGRAGKFFFNQGNDTLKHTGTIAPEQHDVYLYPYQDLKINYNLGGTQDPAGTITGFRVTDNSGNTYYFEKSEVTYPDSWGYDFGLTPRQRYTRDIYGNPIDLNNSVTSGKDFHYYRSAWYLTKIVTYENRQITFNYANENYSIRRPETYSVRGFNTGTSTSTSAQIDCSSKYGDNMHASNMNREDGMQGVRLTSIETDQIKIVFEANEARQDLSPTSALTAVVVYAKRAGGTLSFVKKTVLNYSYTQSPADPLNNYNTTYGSI